MNLDKLTPAPWRTAEDNGLWYLSGPKYFLGLPENDDSEGHAFLEFAALARNAFDVMMRRGWSPDVCTDGKWRAMLPGDGYGPDEPASQVSATDPFTALVEADKWYRENVEVTSSQQVE